MVLQQVSLKSAPWNRSISELRNQKFDVFRTELGKSVFENKYAGVFNNWVDLCDHLVEEVMDHVPCITRHHIERMKELMIQMKFIPGGRYIYYAGRPSKFYNNCYLLRAEEDTRADWADVAKRATLCLSSGGGIGIDYSVYREKGAPLKKTGGKASGPITWMKAINSIGRSVMQGGSRRSAIYASLNWKHPDANDFLTVKDWKSQPIYYGANETYFDIKQKDFYAEAPLDYTNISLNYDNQFIKEVFSNEDIYLFSYFNRHAYRYLLEHNKLTFNSLPDTFVKNVYYAMLNGEPGFSFNFFNKENETLRNACTEVTSEDDSDVCNLGSINLAAISSLQEMVEVTYLGTLFLLAGTLKAELPYDRVYQIREKNRRLGLGLMGVHEFMIMNNIKFNEIDKSQLMDYLNVYKHTSEETAKNYADAIGISRPVAIRAIAPTGTIALLAGTTSGIEPIYATTYKRTIIDKDNQYTFQYVEEAISKMMRIEYGVNPDDLETSISLSENVAGIESRIRAQSFIQDYVDMGISSTVNLPAFGTDQNNEDKVYDIAHIVAKYAPLLRGLTFYPDGARGGQPITPVPFKEVEGKEGKVFSNTDICDLTHGGFCGI